MAYVQTTDGNLVDGRYGAGKPDSYNLVEAQASAAERNQRAEKLGIKTRYEAAGE